jgi:hypothetical protein
MAWMIWDSNPSRGERLASSPKHPDWLQGSPSLLFSGYKGLFPVVKQLGYEAYHLTSI